MKVVINRCCGVFGLSDNARTFMGWTKQKARSFCDYKNRTDPELIRCIETLGEAANGEFAYLKIVEIPDDVDWIIEEYDGKEWIAEKHREWY